MVTELGLGVYLLFLIAPLLALLYYPMDFPLGSKILLTFIVPSGIARVVIMASIALGLAEAFKSGVGSNVSRGMFLILSYTANIFDKMIIAGAGSITARGLIEKVGGVRGALELLVHRLPAVQHHHGAGRVVANVVAVPAGKGHARRRQGISARGTA